MGGTLPTTLGPEASRRIITIFCQLSQTNTQTYTPDKHGATTRLEPRQCVPKAFLIQTQPMLPRTSIKSMWSEPLMFKHKRMH